MDSRVKLNGTKSTYEPVARDQHEKFVYEHVVDLSRLEPTVACHPDPGQRKKAKDMDMKLDRAYVGSCTGRQDERLRGVRPRVTRQTRRH